MMFRLIIFLFSFSTFLLIPEAGAINKSLLELTSPYKKVLRKYTREGKIYSMKHLDTVYRWYATYQSPTFRKAVQEKMDKLYPYGLSERTQASLEPIGNDHQTEFFVALYARDQGLKRMHGEENLWEIHLVVDNETFRPVKVERLKTTPYLVTFYPYLDKWHYGYRVVFPYNIQSSDAKKMILALSSVGGTSQVKFKVLK